MEQRVEKNHGSKQKLWQRHIDNWRQSGQSQQRYCKSQGLALATFGYWRRKLKKGHAEKPRFYPLVLSGQPLRSEPGHTSNPSLRVILGDNRFTIEIDDHFSPEALREVVIILERL